MNLVPRYPESGLERLRGKGGSSGGLRSESFRKVLKNRKRFHGAVAG